MDNMAPAIGVLVLIALAVFLYRLLTGGRYRDFRQRMILKSLCSLMFWIFSLIALWYAKAAVVPFIVFMITGFTLSVLGDVLLAFRTVNTFIFGLLSFFLAHAAYSVSFIMRYGFGSDCLITFAVISVVFLVFMNFSGLFDFKEMLLPANLYLLVLSFMLANAVCSLLNPEHRRLSSFLTAFGALLFFVSDSILAYEKFSSKPSVALEKPVLITYYSAQVFLALGMAAFPV